MSTTTFPALTGVEATDIDRLAVDVLAAPEDAEMYLDRGAVIVHLASRTYELRRELNEVLTEWASLQIDYRTLLDELRNARANLDRLQDAAARFAAELGTAPAAL